MTVVGRALYSVHVRVYYNHALSRGHTSHFFHWSIFRWPEVVSVFHVQVVDVLWKSIFVSVGLQLFHLSVSSPDPAPTMLHDHDTLLTYAARIGDVDTVEDLLAGGADADEPMKNGSNVTPLFIASTYGNEDVVRVLLEDGAAINHADDYGFTPLLMANTNGHATVARLLIQRGAS